MEQKTALELLARRGALVVMAILAAALSAKGIVQAETFLSGPG